MNIKFTSGQLFRLFFMYNVATTNFQIQRLFQLADYEGWISILIGFLVSILLAYFAVLLANAHPDQEWTD
jgi:hypothetical protein